MHPIARNIDLMICIEGESEPFFERPPQAWHLGEMVKMRVKPANLVVCLRLAPTNRCPPVYLVLLPVGDRVKQDTPHVTASCCD